MDPEATPATPEFASSADFTQCTGIFKAEETVEVVDRDEVEESDEDL
jgi:hypothetical protein